MGTCHRRLVLGQTIVERAGRSIGVDPTAAAVAIVGQLAAGSTGSIEVVVLGPGTVCSSDQLEFDCAGQRYHKLGSWGTCWGRLQLGTLQLIVLMHMQRMPE